VLGGGGAAGVLSLGPGVGVSLGAAVVGTVLGTTALLVALAVGEASWVADADALGVGDALGEGL